MALKASKGRAWAVWAILLIPFIYMAAVVMPGVQQQMMSVADDPHCAVPLDLMMFGISDEAALTHLACMGETGRAVYRAAELKQDTIYPLFYGAFLAFTLWALASFGGITRNRGLLVLLPIIAVAFDYMENHYIVELIDQFPHLAEGTVDMASMGNQMKWSFAMLSMVMVLILAALGGIRVWRGR